MPSCLRMWENVCVCVSVHKLVSGLFPRRNHAHWLASREAPSQHVHDWGQVRVLCFPPTHHGSRGGGRVQGVRPQGGSRRAPGPRRPCSSPTRPSGSPAIVFCRPLCWGHPVDTAAGTSTARPLAGELLTRPPPGPRASCPHSPSGRGACLAACPGSAPAPARTQPGSGANVC